MKKFLASTATVLALSTAAFAQSHTSAFSEMTFDQAINLNASEVIGQRVYASEAAIENDTPIASVDDLEWEDIGEINEILLTRDGEVQSVIVGVGGFLGIGEKDVAVSMDQIQFVMEEDGEDYFIVVQASAAGVEEAPSYARPMAAGADMSDENMTDTDMAHSDDSAMADREVMVAPTMERDGYADTEMSDLNTEDLTGARVYNTEDEDIGEVSELLVTADGQIDRAVIDVGGFLELGEYRVALPVEELQIIRSEDGNDVRIYVDGTKEALQAQPEYEG